MASEQVTPLLSHAFFPPALTAIKTGKHLFETAEGLIPFEERGHYWVMAGEPLAESEAKRTRVFATFHRAARTREKIICGYYLSENMEFEGYDKVPLGTSSLLSLDQFSLRGHPRRDIRRALNRCYRDGLVVTEVDSLVERGNVEGELKRLFVEWLRTRRGPQIHFFLSAPSALHGTGTYERWFTVRSGGRLEAFVSLLPYWDSSGRPSYYLDDMIHRPGGQRFAMDYLLTQLIGKLQEEGAGTLSLGLNPFHGVAPKSLLEAGLWLHNRMPLFYRAQSLWHFKKKYTDHYAHRYMLFDRNHSRWPQFAAMLLATYQHYGDLEEQPPPILSSGLQRLRPNEIDLSHVERWSTRSQAGRHW